LWKWSKTVICGPLPNNVTFGNGEELLARTGILSKIIMILAFSFWA